MYRKGHRVRITTRVVWAAAAVVTLCVPAHSSPHSPPDRPKEPTTHDRVVAIIKKRLEETTNETRAIAVVLEYYARDHKEAYPGPTTGVVTMEWLVREIPELEGFPRTDVWGRDFLYWSDGRDYVVISGSADKL